MCQGAYYRRAGRPKILLGADIMIKKGQIVMLALCCSLTVLSSISADTPIQKGLYIAGLVSKANEGFKGEHTKGRLTIITKGQPQIKREFEFYAKETATGDKNLSRILWPLDAKGIALLSWTHTDRDDDQWIYLPEMNKVRRLNVSNQKGSFLGSEFSYEDIASHLNSVSPYKYSYIFIKEDTINGRLCWVIDRHLKIESSRYSKHTLWIDKEYQNPVKIEYYDKKGDLLKVEISEDFRKIKGPAKSFWTPFVIHMKNVQTLKESMISWENRTIGLNLPETMFDSNTLSEQ